MKCGGERVVDWIWRLCNMAFESHVVPEDWRSCCDHSTVQGKGERTGCSNYRRINLSVVGKIYAEILIDRVHKVTESLMDDK